jgi:hypothetical protein
MQYGPFMSWYTNLHPQPFTSIRKGRTRTSDSAKLHNTHSFETISAVSLCCRGVAFGQGTFIFVVYLTKNRQLKFTDKFVHRFLVKPEVLRSIYT